MKNIPQKVFFDANVIIQEGKAGGPIIKRLIDLVDTELISVLTTDLTMEEVTKKHVENDLDLVKDFARPHIRAILNDVLDVKLPEISKAKIKEALVEKYRKSTKKMFDSLDATILSIDDIQPSKIFGAYSQREGFFSGEGKKDQFPDAFIFECIKNIANSSPIIIVSADKDYIGPVKAADNISIVKTFAELFATLGLEIQAPVVEKFFTDEHEKLVSAFDEEVSSWGLQVSDVVEGEIDESTVTNVELDHFTAFRSIGASGDILVTGRATVTADVLYSHPDWTTASWDSEDKILIPWEHVNGETDVVFDVPFSMTLSVDKSGNPVTLDNLTFLDDSFVYVEIEPDENYK